VLLNALMAYTGTVVFVSHDRYFIDKLATRVFEVVGGKVEIYPGNYEDYLWRKQGGNGAGAGLEPMAEAVPATEAEDGNGAQGQSKKRLNPIKRRQMEERVHELEEEIGRLEAGIAHCESALLTFVSAEETQRLNQELRAHRAELDSLLAEWEELSQGLAL